MLFHTWTPAAAAKPKADPTVLGADQGTPPVDVQLGELKLRKDVLFIWFALIVICLVSATVAHLVNFSEGATAALHLAEVLAGLGVGGILGERSGATAKTS